MSAHFSRVAGVAAACVVVVSAAGPVTAQQSNSRVSTKQYRGTTNAPKSDYSVSYGGQDKKPRSYDLYYNRDRYAGTLRPARVAAPVSRVVRPTGPVRIGTVERYSAEDYSKMILDMIEEDREKRAPLVAEPVVEETTAPVKPAQPGVVLSKATVTSVTDEAILVTDEAGELRLRGVMFPAPDSTNDGERDAANGAIDAVRSMLVGGMVYYTTEEPYRDGKGRDLVIAHLSDGTELNRLVVESGLARVNPYDFARMSDADRLLTVQKDAAEAGRGVWAP